MQATTMPILGKTRLVVRLSLVALIGNAFFVGAVLLLPLFSSDLNPARDAISDYANGPNGYVQTVAFLLCGIGVLCLAFGLRLTLWGLPGSKAGPILVGLFGTGNIVAGLFPKDAPGKPATLSGNIHNITGIIIFILMSVGILLLSRSFKRAPDLSKLHPLTVGAGGLACVLFFVTGASQGSSWYGLVQRGLVGTFLLWVLVVAYRLARPPLSTTVALNRK